LTSLILVINPNSNEITTQGIDPVQAAVKMAAESLGHQTA